MTVEVIELQDDSGELSERQVNHRAKREWLAKGTFSHDEAHSAIREEVDETITVGSETLYLDRLQTESIEADLWKGIASYISEEELTEQQQEQERREQEHYAPRWSVDTTGGTHHITSSYEQRKFGDGQDGRIHTEYSNAINARKTKTGWDVKGIDVVIPALELTATIKVPSDDITIDFIQNIARATGKTNSAPWYGFETGELLFKGASFDAEVGGECTIRFVFSASQNITAEHNFKVGDIGPIIKGGHEYLWVEYMNIDEFDREGKQAVFPRAKYAYVDKIYLSFNFTALGIGG